MGVSRFLSKKKVKNNTTKFPAAIAFAVVLWYATGTHTNDSDTTHIFPLAREAAHHGGKHMKKLWMVFLLALCLTLLSGAIFAADREGTGKTELTAADIYLSDGSYYLKEDLTITHSLYITGTVTLDLQGHILQYVNEAENGAVVVIESDGALTLTDSQPDIPHKFRVNEVDLWTPDEENGTEILYGGVIAGGTGVSEKGYARGGCVYNKGTFTMESGTITGGQAIYGGGIYSTGTFILNDGTIQGCHSWADGLRNMQCRNSRAG